MLISAIFSSAGSARRLASPAPRTHLVGLVDANATVILEIEAEILEGASDRVVRTVTKNNWSLKFTSQGFEKELAVVLFAPGLRDPQRGKAR